MFNPISFLFYKLYRYAKAQEETVNLIFGFLALSSVFEALHLLIFIHFIEDFFGFKIHYPDLVQQYAGIILIIAGFSLNYLFFIKTNLIYKIDSYYSNKNWKLWLSNLLFFLYILFMFFILFIQAIYHVKK